jgi:DNA-binding CsgD family transcriptional regulator
MRRRGAKFTRAPSGADGQTTGCAQVTDGQEILDRYVRYARRLDEVAPWRGNATAEVIPFQGRLRELEQKPSIREVEVLQLVSDGLTNREIATRQFVSEETVKSHIRRVLAKLPARSRAQAVAVGFRHGVIA